MVIAILWRVFARYPSFCSTFLRGMFSRVFSPLFCSTALVLFIICPLLQVCFACLLALVPNSFIVSNSFLLLLVRQLLLLARHLFPIAFLFWPFAEHPFAYGRCAAFRLSWTVSWSSPHPDMPSNHHVPESTPNQPSNLGMFPILSRHRSFNHRCQFQ